MDECAYTAHTTCTCRIARTMLLSFCLSSGVLTQCCEVKIPNNSNLLADASRCDAMSIPISLVVSDRMTISPRAQLHYQLLIAAASRPGAHDMYFPKSNLTNYVDSY